MSGGGRMDCSRYHQPRDEERRMDLEVVGRHALLFDDDSTAAFVNSPDALVPWSGGDASLLIDRFDARHLLLQLPVRGALKRQIQVGSLLEPDGVARIDLDAERFRDLDNGRNGEDQPVGDGQQDEEAKRIGAESSNYRTVPFSYTTTSGNSLTRQDGLATSCYRPPFPVPQHLLSNLPPTKKAHQIITRTAKFVIKHGGQTEIILRVKQGGNPTFGFLMPDHKLHPYFRYLIDHPELSEDVTDPVGSPEKEKTPDIEDNKLHVSTVGGALSMLESVYGSMEDDGDPDATEDRKTLDKSIKPCFKPPIEETKAVVKVSTTIKEKPLHSIRSVSSIMFPSGAVGSGSRDVTAGTSKPVSNSSKIAGPVVEPPSFLKPMIEKTAEFISRNGREFEASLIQQDNKNDKFPFLCPSNLYHSYYLEVLQHTREGNLPYKSLSDESRSSARNAEKQLEAPLQLDKKEKFRMALGAGSKPPKPPGLSAEETAAIVMGATRGLYMQNQTASDVPNTPSIQVPDAIRRAVDLVNGSSSKTDSSAADDQQKLKAERLKRAKMFADMIKSGKLKANEDSQDKSREGSTVKQSEGDSQDTKEENGREHSSKRHRSRHSNRHRRRRHEDAASDGDEHRHRRHRSSSSSSKRERENENDSSHRERTSRPRHSHDHHHREKKPSSRDEVEVQESSQQLVSETKPSPATEIPDDLRAKIRAMLLDTL